MIIKTLLGSVAALALASAAQAQVAVQIWTNVPASVSQNATISPPAGLPASPNATTTVGGINFSTDHSDLTTIGDWLGNPAGLDATTAATTLNNAYMLFSGQISLVTGDNFFSIAHDDGLQLSIDGIGMVVNTPGPTSPTTNLFDAVAPSDGVYNFTLSYGECCAGPAVLTWFFNGAPVGGAVPEPATWAMMLLGFGGIGFAMRRGRKQNGRLLQAA